MGIRRHNFIERSIMGTLSFLKESVFADEYAAKRGFLQARDPRIKSLSILFFLLAILFSKSVYFLIGMYAFCLVLAGLSSIPTGFFLKRTWIFIPLFSLFIAVPALFNIFTPGEPLLTFKLGSFVLSITRQGVASASIFFMRVLSSVSFCVLLALTTRHYVLLKVLRAFGVPQIFVMTLGMCYRYIYLFIEIIENTYTAIKSRVGFVTSSASGQRVVSWNIASLWQRSYHLHNDVYSAMLSRGYSGEPKAMDEFCARPKDWLWFLSVSVFLAASLLWKKYFLS